MNEVPEELGRSRRDIPAAPIQRIRVVEFRLLEQFLSHENEGHTRCGEGENGGQGTFSPRDQTQRGILVGIGDQSSFLIEASGFIVVFRVDHAAQSKVRLHP